MIKFDADSVWVIQAWQGNPSTALVNGLAGRKEHALVLDLYADKTPHWNDSNYSGGKEFQSTPWVYCMLNNFGGRMGLHGHMDNLVNGVAEQIQPRSWPESELHQRVRKITRYYTIYCLKPSGATTQMNRLKKLIQKSG